jgi:hypothetical protein
MNPRLPWSIDEAVLYALVARAWEARGTSAFRPAIAQLVDGIDRAPLSWLERCEQRRERNQWLIELMKAGT